jgi:hypothetical protein
MFWFLLFAGVAVVWTVVLTLLGVRLWRRAKALFGELSAAQTKLDAAQTKLDTVPAPSEPIAQSRRARHAGTRA